MEGANYSRPTTEEDLFLGLKTLYKTEGTNDFISIEFPQIKGKSVAISIALALESLTNLLGLQLYIHSSSYSSKSILFAITPSPEVYFLLESIRNFIHNNLNYKLKYIFGIGSSHRFFVQGIKDNITLEFLNLFFSKFGLIKELRNVHILVRNNTLPTNFYIVEFFEKPILLDSYRRIKIPTFRINWILRKCTNKSKAHPDILNEQIMFNKNQELETDQSLILNEDNDEYDLGLSENNHSTNNDNEENEEYKETLETHSELPILNFQRSPTKEHKPTYSDIVKTNINYTEVKEEKEITLDNVLKPHLNHFNQQKPTHHYQRVTNHLNNPRNNNTYQQRSKSAIIEIPDSYRYDHHKNAKRPFHLYRQDANNRSSTWKIKMDQQFNLNSKDYSDNIPDPKTTPNKGTTENPDMEAQRPNLESFELDALDTENLEKQSPDSNHEHDKFNVK